LALEGKEVRGVVNFFKHQLWFPKSSEAAQFVWLNGLVTEGIIDRGYAPIALALMRATLARQPRQMIFGPLGTEASMPRLLMALRWLDKPVPVLVLAVRSAIVVRELQRLRRHLKLRVAGRAAAAAGLTSLVDLGLAGLRRLHRARDVRVEEVDRFASWSDAVWSAAQPLYGALPSRCGRSKSPLSAGRPAIDPPQGFHAADSHWAGSC
jgi:hypothetical protein